MANAWGGNVLVVDTTAAFAIPLRIKKIRYEAAASGPAVTIRETDSNGTIVFFCDDANDGTHDVCIKTTKGIHVTIAGTGTKAFLYTE